MGILNEETLASVYTGEDLQEERLSLQERLYPKLPDTRLVEGIRKAWLQIQVNRASDKWIDYYLALKKIRDERFAGNYRVSVKDLLKRASYRASPEVKINTVTEFTSWIYSLYLGRPDPEKLAKGKQGEKEIARHFPAPDLNGFKLVYKDPLSNKPSPLKISSLRCNQQPLWGAPDLVYEHTESKTLYIIERKTVSTKTLMESGLPLDSWPNLRAQLWAYSHIDQFQGYKKVVLIGEAWKADGKTIPNRVALWRWESSEAVFDQENLKMFHYFGGERIL